MAPKFSLQSVLDYRKTIVDKIEQELAQILIRDARAKGLLSALRQNRDALFTELTEKQLGELDLALIEQLRENIKTRNTQIELQLEIIQEISVEITEKQKEIVLAKQDEEVLVKLKENNLAEYELKIEKKEQEMLDDIYIAQAHRKMHFQGGI